ncbi:hypothetical protein FC756_25280 [Lysinibacillus mangiferihumi]|uniref:DUF4355 domain-containing protein n=1 Tax=Lysinibacillus mangiferihumi TaxID=1130819 RepID=A0A4U2XYY5_9BACI|nr:hypothetical protein [Lysinibacillus mangiferihumi]TKI53188.1 hypothetical protein FC756_25280 [Lysinibacillus mangiferihumi]
MENLQTAEVTEMESIEVADTNEAPLQEQQGNPLEQERQELLEEIERLEQEKVQYENLRLQLQLEERGFGYAKEFVEQFGFAKTPAEKVDALAQLINEVKLDIGFKPKEVAKQDDYTAHKQNGDAKGMIASKFSKLFK